MPWSIKKDSLQSGNVASLAEGGKEWDVLHAPQDCGLRNSQIFTAAC